MRILQFELLYMKYDKKIKILGFEEGSVAFLIETCLETDMYNFFDIILNMDHVPEDPLIALDDKMVSITHETDYEFDEADETPVHFGVLHSHIKYVLFQYFLSRHNINQTQYQSFVHPLAYFPESSTFENGFYIGQLSAVTSFTKFGFGVTIKKNCSIGHHSKFGDFVTMNPGAVVAGYTNIGEGTEIGVGARVSNNIRIGKNCLIGAGSVVTKDIPDDVVAYGNPCRVIRKNERWEKAKSLTKDFLLDS